MFTHYVFTRYLSQFAYFSLLSVAPAAESSTLSLHDALPILSGGITVASQSLRRQTLILHAEAGAEDERLAPRSEEHTSELQSRPHLVCRLLLEKKKYSATSTIGSPSTLCARLKSNGV